MSAGGGCEAVVFARTRFEWAKFRDCSELLFGMRFSLRVKGVLFKRFVRPAILHGCEAWCFNESKVGFLYEGQRDSW